MHHAPTALMRSLLTAKVIHHKEMIVHLRLFALFVITDPVLWKNLSKQSLLGSALWAMYWSVHKWVRLTSVADRRHHWQPAGVPYQAEFKLINQHAVQQARSSSPSEFATIVCRVGLIKFILRKPQLLPLAFCCSKAINSFTTTQSTCSAAAAAADGKAGRATFFSKPSGTFHRAKGA